MLWHSPAGDDTAEYDDQQGHTFSTRDRLRSPSEASTSYLSDDIDRIQQTRNASSVLWGLFQRGHDVEGAVSRVPMHIPSQHGGTGM